MSRCEHLLVASGGFLLGLGGLGFIVVVLIAAGAFLDGPRTLPIYSSCGTAAARTPQAAVRGYFTALSERHFEVAAQYVAPSECRYFQEHTWDDWGNIKKLTDLSVLRPEVLHPRSVSNLRSFWDDAAVYPRRDFISHSKWVGDWAEFTITYYAPEGEENNGPTGQALLLGRSIKSGGWEIVDEPQV